MSFDVFLLRLRDPDGTVRGGGNAMVRTVLGPDLVVAAGVVTGLRTRDGDAELYGLDGDDGFMATHLSGAVVWDLLVVAARAADLVILPVGCPTCLVHEDQRRHLPENLSFDVAVVADGADLLRVVTGS